MEEGVSKIRKKIADDVYGLSLIPDIKLCFFENSSLRYLYTMTLLAYPKQPAFRCQPHLLEFRIVTVTGSNRGVLEMRAFLAGPPES